MDANSLAIYKQRQGMLRQNRSQKSTPVSLPAPVKGWNTIASLADMDPQEASSITNFLPGLGFVRLRKGYQKYAQSIGSGSVQTLAEYWSGNVHKMLAASSTNIYDTAGNAATYAPNAVDNNGSAYLLKSTGLTGLVNGKAGTLSFWIRFDGVPVVTPDILSISGGTSGQFVVFWDYFGTGALHIRGLNAAGTLIMDIVTAEIFAVGTTWYNILCNWDLSAGTKNVYINNVSSLGSASPFTNDTIDWSGRSGIFSSFSGTGLINCSLSEVWFNPASIDLSSAPNRAKYISTNIFPVSLGADGSTPTGSQPILYLNGSASSFQTNKGSGGSYITTGSLTNSISTPATAGLSLGSGYTNGRWQSAMFLNNLFMCNGFDTPQIYNGSTLANATLTGPTIANLIGCNVYRNRLWVWEKNKQSVWYSATSTIGGAYTQFNLYDVGFFGGNLIGCATFTHDGGNGPDDYICFVLSSGQVLVYSGDPASTFSIVGVFQTGLPLDVRAVCQFGGDVLIGTVNDYVLLSQIISASYVPSKISGAVQAAAAAYSTNTGWQTISWSKGALLLVNIPTTSTTFDQHVFNTVTGAWTKYTNIPSYCWCIYNGDLYFGGNNGVVYKAETGLDDDGSVISGDVTQAFSSLGMNGRMLVRGYRPVIQADGALTYNSGISYDFQTKPVTQTTSSVQSGPFWNQAYWDTSLWGQAAAIIQDWKTGFGRGYQAAVRLVIQTSDQNVYWYRTDFLIEPGGPI